MLCKNKKIKKGLVSMFQLVMRERGSSAISRASPDVRTAQMLLVVLLLLLLILLSVESALNRPKRMNG